MAERAHADTVAGMRLRAHLFALVAPALLPVAAVGVPVAQARWARRNSGRLVGPPHGVAGMVGMGETGARVAWLGDSLAAGVGAGSADETLARLVAQYLLERAGSVQVEVFAVSGSTVGDVAEHQLPMLLADAPFDLVIVSAGANDVAARTRLAALRGTYRTIFDALAGTPVIALGVPDLGDAIRIPQPLRAIARFQGRRIDRVLRAAAADTGHVTVVDVSAASTTEHRREIGRYLAGDRYHPNGDGYRVWAASIAAALPAAMAAGRPVVG